MKQTENTNQPKKKTTSKQIVAIVGVVLLILLYVITLFAAIFDSSASGRMFQACLFATVAIPLLIWIYTWMWGKFTGKSTIADLNIGKAEKSGSSSESTANAGSLADK